MADNVTLEDEIAEQEREMKMRQRLYPKWIEEGKMKKHIAAHRLACTAATLDRLLRAKHSREPTLL